MQIDFDLLKRVTEVDLQFYGRHLEKSMQNDMLMAVIRSTSQPEVEFKYGRRLISEL